MNSSLGNDRRILSQAQKHVIQFISLLATQAFWPCREHSLIENGGQFEDGIVKQNTIDM
jgi:hypothetical protein